MLAVFRRFLNTWPARAFFLVLVAAFALWGVADMLKTAGRDNAVATVGARRIEPAEFQDTYRRQLARITRLLGGRVEPTPQMRRGIAEQTLERLVMQAAVLDETSRLGLTVPDTASRTLIFGMAEFHGAAGTFDRARFDAILRSNNLTERRFLEMVRGELAQQQLLEAVHAGAGVPELLVAQVFAFQKEMRVAEIVELPFTAAPEPPAPSEDDLRRTYENNAPSYSAPEFRRIKAVILSPETIARGIEVSDEDVRAYYEQHRGEFTTGERRTVQVIVATDEEKARALATAWIAGADWEAMQKAASDAGASALALDDAGRAEIPTPDLAEAAFAAAPETVVGPIRSPFGWQILRVSKVTPSAERTLEQAAAEIRTKVALERAGDDIYNRVRQLEDLLAAGTGLDALPGDIGLAAITGTLNDAGNTRDGEPAPIPGTPALRQALIAAAFGTAQGAAPEVKEGPDQSFYALVVEETSPPALKPFAEVEGQVRADWEHAARRRAQEEVASKLLGTVNAGGSLDDAATVAGLRVTRTPPLSRSSPPEGVAPQLLPPVFALQAGKATMVETPQGFIVARLDSVIAPEAATDPAAAAPIRSELKQALERDLQASYAAALRNRAQPRVNRQFLDSLAE